MRKTRSSALPRIRLLFGLAAAQANRRTNRIPTFTRRQKSILLELVWPYRRGTSPRLNRAIPSDTQPVDRCSQPLVRRDRVR